MIGWILDKLFGLIPFLHGREKGRVAAKAKLQYLRAHLILFALQGSIFAGKYDRKLIEWAKGQLVTSHELVEYDRYGEVVKALDLFLRHPNEVEQVIIIAGVNDLDIV
ncbi:hypothetical protein [Rhodocaloribacter sp.]